MKRAITPGQINIPRRPRSGEDVKYVVDGLVTAVQQLRDRPTFYNQGKGGGGSFSHMWQAAKTGETDGESPFPIFQVKGGIAVIQGTRVEVADVAELEATSETGFICLKTVRDEDSRALDTDATPSNPSIVWQDAEPVSDYAEEYTVLAEYLEDEKVRQCRFHEICSYEMMHVANGELKLLPFQANSRNSYDLPS
jgi:hypothetical protein